MGIFLLFAAKALPAFANATDSRQANNQVLVIRGKRRCSNIATTVRERREGTRKMDRMKTPLEELSNEALLPRKRARSLCLFAALACVITFFTLFHEVSHAFIRSLPSAGEYASFYSCLFHSCGAFAGAAFCLAPPVSRFIRTHRRAFLTIVCWMLVAFGAIYGFELFVNASAIGTHAAETVGAALCTMYAVELIAWQSQLDTRTLAIGLAGVIAVCACGSYLVFPLITQLFSPVEVSAFQCAFAVGALILTFKGLPAKSRPDEPSEETYPNTMPSNGPKRETTFPDGISSTKRFFANLSKHWALVLHPLAYGFTFGVLHETVGIFRLMGAGRNYLEFVGAMLAADLAGPSPQIHSQTVQRPARPQQMRTGGPRLQPVRPGMRSAVAARPRAASGANQGRPVHLHQHHARAHPKHLQQAGRTLCKAAYRFGGRRRTVERRAVGTG